ncbi:MAG: T9SS type A sorting domain-containing protein [Crocinitomix sp.]|nr:T9SS type A sorting domain-containing protein [Crocinitomix sp.]
MVKWIKTGCFLVFLLIFSEGSIAQIVDRSTFSVFQPIGVNDTLLLAGGQIMTGESTEPTILHGYYPLNYSLLSVDEVDFNDEISIFPNPFVESFVINLQNQDYSMVTIEILSMNGQVLSTFQSSNQQIDVDLTGVASGVYHVRVSTENQVIANTKVVKQS